VATQQIASEPGWGKSFGWKAWALTFGLLQGLAFVWAFAGFWSSYPTGIRFLAIPSLLVAVWFVTLIHEIGHALATILVGWRVAAFAAGPLGIQLVNRQLAIIPESKRTEMEGFVLPVPATAAVFTRGRNALIDVAGPATSLAVAIVGIVIGISHEKAYNTGFDPAGLALGVGVLSLIIAGHTILPLVPNDRLVDGQRFLSRFRTEDALWRRYRAFSSLQTLTKYQVRLRDLPEWLLAEAKCAAESDADLTKAYESMVIGIVLDSAPVDATNARQLLDDFRAKYGGSAWLDSCDAYFTAVWEGDGERARERLWDGEPAGDMAPMQFAAEAAVQARLGDPRSARMLIAKMREAIRKRSAFPDPTFQDIERQILALLPR
jgi:hypothetical protein